MQTLIKNATEEFNEEKFINFLNNEGITVKTNTKARGNLGICYKNRIDISTRAFPERRMAILAHEYAHKIHLNIEQESFKNGGTLEALFKTNELDSIKNELKRVTHFVDENSLFLEFTNKKNELKNQIKELEIEIKKEHPDFKRSQEFKPIKSYFKKNKSNAKYLLKYDNVKLVHPIFKKEEFYSIKTIAQDFPEMPESFKTYIKLNSLQKQQKKLSRRINKAKQYYNRPTELFARFIEGLFIDKKTVKLIAPKTYEQFVFLLKNNYYGNLKTLLELAEII